MTIEKGLNGLDNNLLKVLGGLESATNLTLTPNIKSGGCSTRQFYYLILYIIFIHSVFSLTTGPKPPPKRCLHIVRCKWEYPLLSLRSSSSFLRLLPRLLATSITLFIFPSITCFRRQFLRKMWPIQLAFLFLISCRIFLCSLTLTSIYEKL